MKKIAILVMVLCGLFAGTLMADYLGSFAVDDTVLISVPLNVVAGDANDADSAPILYIFKDDTSAAIWTGYMVKFAGETGFYAKLITLSDANSFTSDGYYTSLITATVGGVTAKKKDNFQILAPVNGVEPNVYYVGAGQTYTTIGAAVTALEAAGTYGTVQIYPGVYAEEVDVSSGKQIHFNGTDRATCIVQVATAASHAFTLQSGCTLENLTAIGEERAVMAQNKNDITIRNCTLKVTGSDGVEDAIKLDDGVRCVVEDSYLFSTYDVIANANGQITIRNSILEGDNANTGVGGYVIITGGSTTTTGHRASIIDNCVLTMNRTTESGAAASTSGVLSLGGDTVVTNSNIYAYMGTNVDNADSVLFGIVVSGAELDEPKIVVSNCVINTSKVSANATAYDLYVNTGEVLIGNSYYDTSKTYTLNGTITDIPAAILTDTGTTLPAAISSGSGGSIYK